MKRNIKNYSQGFLGNGNDIMNSLSRYFHLSPQTRTQFYHSLIPEQMPEDFQIKSLPSGVKLLLQSLLQQLPEGKQGKKQHQKSKLVRGQDGKLSYNKLNTQNKNSLTILK